MGWSYEHIKIGYRCDKEVFLICDKTTSNLRALNSPRPHGHGHEVGIGHRMSIQTYIDIPFRLSFLEGFDNSAVHPKYVACQL